MLADLILVLCIASLFGVPILVLAAVDRFTAWLWRDDGLADRWEWPHGR